MNLRECLQQDEEWVKGERKENNGSILEIYEGKKRMYIIIKISREVKKSGY